jgi:uncharacterized membrane protein YciS (DUF1049 family)
VNRYRVIRLMCYVAILGAFANGIYKLYVIPHRATLFDFCLVIGSIVIAGIFTLAEQLKTRRQLQMKRKGACLSKRTR